MRLVGIVEGEDALGDQERELINVQEQALQVVSRDLLDVFNVRRVGENPQVARVDTAQAVSTVGAGLGSTTPITVASEAHDVVAIWERNFGVPFHADPTLNFTLQVEFRHVTAFLVPFLVPLLTFGLLLEILHPSHPCLQLLQ